MSKVLGSMLMMLDTLSNHFLLCGNRSDLHLKVHILVLNVNLDSEIGLIEEVKSADTARLWWGWLMIIQHLA